MNCRTRSSIRDGRRSRRRIGEKIQALRIGFGRTRTYEKHPENFMVLGVPVSPLILSHLNHPICTFQNHRMWSDIQYLKNARLYYIDRPCLCQLIIVLRTRDLMTNRAFATVWDKNSFHMCLSRNVNNFDYVPSGRFSCHRVGLLMAIVFGRGH